MQKPLAGWRLLRSKTRTETVYAQATTALLVSWKDDEASVRKHVNFVQSVLADVYGFDIERVELRDESTQDLLQSKVTEAIKKYSNGRHLIIVYHIGKGWVSQGVHYWGPLSAQTSRKNCRIEWLSLQAALRNAESDTLFILDCEYDNESSLNNVKSSQSRPGLLAVDPGRMEVLATCQTVQKIRPGAFTQGLMKLLRSWSEKESFSVYQLYHHLTEGLYPPMYYNLSPPSQSFLRLGVRPGFRKVNRAEADVTTDRHGTGLTPQLARLQDIMSKPDNGTNMIAWNLDASQTKPESGDSAMRLLPKPSDRYHPRVKAGWVPETRYGIHTRKKVDTPRFGPNGEYRAICKLYVEFEAWPDEWADGTGWLIDEETVVTAAHCLWHKQYGHVTRVKVYIGYEGRDTKNNKNLVYRAGKHVLVNMGFYVLEREAGDRKQPYDLAFIRLTQPFNGVKPIRWMECPLQMDNSKVRVVGYPYDLEKAQYMYEAECTTTINLEQDRFMIKYPLDTYEGNSGAPVLMINNKGNFDAIGVHCYGGQDQDDHNLASSIGHHTNVFEAFLQGLKRSDLQTDISGVDAEELDGTASSLTWLKVRLD